MRYLLTTCLLYLALATPSKGQSSSGILPKGIRIGVQAQPHLNFNYLSKEHYMDGKIKFDPLPALTFGALLRGSITNKFDWEAGATIGKVGYKTVRHNSYPGQGRFTHRGVGTSYSGVLQAPLQALYIIGKPTDRYRKTIGAGVHITYNPYWDSSVGKGGGSYDPYTNDTTSIHSFNISPSNKLSYGLLFTYSVETNIRHFGIIGTGLVYHQGLSMVKNWNITTTTTNGSRISSPVTYNSILYNRGTFLGLRVYMYIDPRAMFRK
jgi:hypothetical protein